MNRIVVRIGPLSAAKIFGAVYLAMGLLFTPFFALPALFADEATPDAFGLGFALSLPVLYAVTGFVGTALVCWVYNFAASKLGGLELELTERQGPV